jgi:dienelactone hydrolase
VVRATAKDERGRAFESTTTVAALRRDPARPLWTLRHGDDPFAAPSRFDVRLDVLEHGKPVAHTAMTRTIATPGVHARDVRDGLSGRLFEPGGTTKRPAVLAFGGSEGGRGGDAIASLLASHGATAMSLAYFHAPGLPRKLAGIPLEYFATALKRLRAQPHVDPRRVFVLGVSRGGEAALLLGATYPRLVHGVVALVPSNVVGPGLQRGSPAWTLHGRPVPFTQVLGDPTGLDEPRAVIRAERITGPVLTVSAGRDGVWPSAVFSAALNERLDRKRFRYPHRDLRIADAGHLVGTALPYLPVTTIPGAGGTPAADEAGRVRAWPEIVRLITGSA